MRIKIIRFTDLIFFFTQIQTLGNVLLINELCGVTCLRTGRFVCIVGE